MVINFSGNYSVKNANSVAQINTASVIGQITQPTITSLNGHHECLGIVFTPVGWKYFVEVDAHELQNKFLEADLLFGNEFKFIIEHLSATKNIERKFELIQNFFLKRHCTSKKPATVSEAIHLLKNAQGNKVTVNYLCKQLNISRKSLNVHFKRHIGLSTYSFFQQMTFNQIIKEISACPHVRLVETGYTHNFFDQAHFIKQFQSFAGMTPGQYSQCVINGRVDQHSPNFLQC